MYIKGDMSSKIGWKATKVNKDKDQISRFLLTVNTNITDEKIREPLRKATETFYSGMDFFVKHQHGEIELKDLVGKIKSYDIEPVIEVGKTMGRVHLHALITIMHTTKLHLDLRKIRFFFTKSLGLPGIHVDVKYIRDPSFTVRKYIEKSLADE